jgi:hypothetical protein
MPSPIGSINRGIKDLEYNATAWVKSKNPNRPTLKKFNATKGGIYMSLGVAIDLLKNNVAQSEAKK